MQNRKKLVRRLAALLVFALVFSALFVVFETGHECVGEDCAVCAALSVCEAVLHSLSLGLLPLLAARVFCRQGLGTRRSAVSAARRFSPVRLEVKLSN